MFSGLQWERCWRHMAVRNRRFFPVCDVRTDRAPTTNVLKLAWLIAPTG